MEDKQLISYVIKTLGDIEVKGKDNISKLLGCIMALEGLLQPSETSEEVEDGR